MVATLSLCLAGGGSAVEAVQPIINNVKLAIVNSVARVFTILLLAICLLFGLKDTLPP